jgi:hypothetical protein
MRKILSVLLILASSLFIASAVNNATGSPAAAVVTGCLLVGGAFIVARAYSVSIMLMSCGTIATGFEAGCDTKPTAGLETRYWVINRSDIDLTSTTFGADGEIDNLVLNVGALAYRYVGKGQSNGVQIDMVEGKYSNDQWAHIFNQIVFDNSAGTKKDIIKVFPSADVVIIYENKWKGTGGDSAFEAIGWTVGLTGKAIQRKSDDADTQAAWKVGLASPKDQFEDNPGINIFDTDYATTLAMLNALAGSSSS